MNKGSEWRIWDLHLHTPSSYDYKDKSVTNEDIVNELTANGVSVVAITDHNTIDIERINELRHLGESKGLTFERVLIYPTSKMIDWIFDHSKEMKSQSKSKFYVGVTRAKYSVGIVFDNKKDLCIVCTTHKSFKCL